MVKKRTLLIALVLIPLLVLVGAGRAVSEDKPADAEEKAKPYEVGSTVKPLVAKNLEGKATKIEFNNKLTAVSFFSSSCSACRMELAFLEKLAASDPNFSVVAVSVDFSLDRVKEFAAETKYKMQFFQDPDYGVPQSFGFSSSPAVVYINKSGKVVFKKMGYMSKDGPELMKAMKENL